MTLFTWLALGHFVGDFVFQNDWMARNKQRALFTIPGFTHFIVYTLCMLITLWGFEQFGVAAFPLTKQQYTVFVALIFISHWLIDATNAAGRWARIIHQSGGDFVRVAVDQTFHLLVVAVMIEWLLR